MYQISLPEALAWSDKHEAPWFYLAQWKKASRYYLLVPIHKKDSVFDPMNYRGVLLTSILSKLAETMLSEYLLPFLEQRFGKFSGHTDEDTARQIC